MNQENIKRLKIISKHEDLRLCFALWSNDETPAFRFHTRGQNLVMLKLG
jgi:hypothetical protein